MIADVRGILGRSLAATRPDSPEGLASSLAALQLGLELLGEAVTPGGRPGLDIHALAGTLDGVVRRLAGTAETLLGNPAAA